MLFSLFSLCMRYVGCLGPPGEDDGQSIRLRGIPQGQDPAEDRGKENAESAGQGELLSVQECGFSLVWSTVPL